MGVQGGEAVVLAARGGSGQADWSPWALAQGEGVREGPPQKPSPRGHTHTGPLRWGPHSALRLFASPSRLPFLEPTHADRALWLFESGGRGWGVGEGKERFFYFIFRASGVDVRRSSSLRLSFLSAQHFRTTFS